jgi:hypothetical protein
MQAAVKQPTKVGSTEIIKGLLEEQDDLTFFPRKSAMDCERSLTVPMALKREFRRDIGDFIINKGAAVPDSPMRHPRAPSNLTVLLLLRPSAIDVAPVSPRAVPPRSSSVSEQ